VKRTGPMIAVMGFFLCVQAAQADWTPIKRLTWTSGGSYEPVIAISSNGHIHIVWSDDTPGNAEIYYKRSTDGGTTWSSARRLTWTSGQSYGPATAIDSNNTIHIVWRDDTPGNAEIYYKKSTDEGTTWSSVQRLTWNSVYSITPALAIDSNNNIHVVCRDDTPGNGEIYYRRSTDGGTIWSSFKRLTWTSGSSEYPAIATDSSNHIHVVWHDFTPGAPEIYYKRSTDGGATWSSDQRLTWHSLYSLGPAIAIDSSQTVHVVWHDYRVGAPEIYYKRSTDGGTTWSPDQRLTWLSGDSYESGIAIDLSSTLHVVWQDNMPGNFEIYYKRSSDGGTAWSTAQRLTWNSLDSLSPAMATDSNNTIHIVWSDNAPGNREIYYRKGNDYPPLPDLVVSSLTVNITPGGGSFTAVVKNNGAALSGASVLRMTLKSGATTLTSKDFDIPTLAPGGQSSTTYDYSGSIMPGTYHLTAYADATDVVTEWNELNNTRTITFSVSSNLTPD
jgi:CARDB/BNR repeat-like domain